MSLRSAIAPGCALLVLGLGGRAFAHDVTVDGSAADWSTRLPGPTGAVPNLGIVARSADGGGEFIWLDPTGDARTDLANPETDADLTELHLTGSSAGLFVLAKFAPSTNPTPAVELQLAMDLDRTAGSGQAHLGGFADTDVGAPWEFLLRTQFGAGTSPSLVDSTFTPVPGALPLASKGTDLIELFVPWSNLGLTGPPSTPIRFTAATFREQANGNTVDIAGTTALADGGSVPTSNALDAVSDYGAPNLRLGDGGYPNTWTEVADGVVDHSFDVWFDARGEVYAPLVVDRFVANSSPTTSSDEWVVVRNVSPVALALDAYKLGDAQLPTSGEGMYLFPAGTTVHPGARFTVAVSASGYKSKFGTLPDAELVHPTDGGALAPDMTKWSGWGTGIWGLNNNGDELVLLDAQDTIIDVANYGTSVYAGITAFTPAPGADVVLGRNADDVDTDDCSRDFFVLPSASSGCASCTQAIGGFCTPSAALTSCDDGNACTTADACDGRGTCVGGAAPSCDDLNPCTVDSCDTVNGCQHAPAQQGVACDDGNPCNGFETCNGLGACVDGGAPSCDDANPCTADSCRVDAGCVHQNLPPNTSCSDGDVCNGAELCDANGTCQPGAALNCDDGNPCTADGCDAVSGCFHADLDAGTPCPDGDACNGLETCDGLGTCQAGAMLNCDDGNVCTADSCDSVAGCVHASTNEGLSCGTDACSGAESCTSGQCLPIGPTLCAAVDDCHDQGICNPADGTCGAGSVLRDGTACDGGTCQSGACVAPSASSSSSGSVGSTSSSSASSSASSSSGTSSASSSSSGATSTSTAGASSASSSTSGASATSSTTTSGATATGSTGTGTTTSTTTSTTGGSTGLTPPPASSSGGGNKGSGASSGGCASASGIQLLALLGLALLFRRRA